MKKIFIFVFNLKSVFNAKSQQKVKTERSTINGKRSQ